MIKRRRDWFFPRTPGHRQQAREDGRYHAAGQHLRALAIIFRRWVPTRCARTHAVFRHVPARSQASVQLNFSLDLNQIATQLVALQGSPRLGRSGGQVSVCNRSRWPATRRYGCHSVKTVVANAAASAALGGLAALGAAARSAASWSVSFLWELLRNLLPWRFARATASSFSASARNPPLFGGLGQWGAIHLSRDVVF